MIKKLKIKLILYNMLLVGIVVAIIFSALYLLTYISEEAKITNALEDNIDFFSGTSGFPPLPEKPQENNDRVYNVFCTVFVDEEGKPITSSGDSMQQEDMIKAVNNALNSETERGNISELNISFLKKHTRQGMLISFVSREHLNTRLKESFVQYILGGIVSMLLFLYISKRLADIAVAPVEKAWEQQKQFLADASHDLKTPLTVILANNNIVTAHKEQSVESQMKWIESTAEEANRMTELVNKMLELAKGEATKEELKIGEVNLSDIVENSILQFEVVAFEKNISIESGIQPNIIVKTHPKTFSKVLEILFDNAIKYSEENGKISLALYQSGKKIYFTINNKGEYIKPDELPHVFERFYRTNKEREVGGHGLGLSIAKKKCDMIGCKLSVESNEYDGTTFIITFKTRRKQK